MSALSAGFAACDEPENSGQKEELTDIGIVPKPTSELPEEFAAFFDENAYRIGQAIIAQEYDDRGGG